MQRFSRSQLWRLQRAYFERTGLSAFSSATVPHYITNNTVIADAYARIVVGYLVDQLPTLDREDHVYLVECGAGSGRFGFLFLRRLTELLAAIGLVDLRFTYVLTDFSDAPFSGWLNHPQLAPYFAAGQLDVAHFDAEADQTLTLVRSQRRLEPGSITNPLVMIANYFFDSIPIDVFTVKAGELFETLVGLTSQRDEADLDDPTRLKRAQLEYTDRPARADYYGDPEIDRLLDLYRTTLKESVVRLPICALRCCQLFSRLSSGRWLLVSGDKGVHDLVHLDYQKLPELTMHGSFSISVNSHAIGEYFAGNGGELMRPDHAHSGLAIVCAVLDRAGVPPRNLRLAYKSAVETFGPDDYMLLRRALEANAAEIELIPLLALIRLSRADPRLVDTLRSKLRKKLAKAGASQRKELVRLVELAWGNYFHIGEASDVPWSIGVLLCDLGHYEHAIERFQSSLEWYGDDASTFYNLALCCKRLGRRGDARGFLERALILKPADRNALDMLARLHNSDSISE